MKDRNTLCQALHAIARQVANGWLGTEAEKEYQVKTAALVAYSLALQGEERAEFETRLDDTVGDSDRISTLFAEVFPVNPCCNKRLFGEDESDGKDNGNCVCLN